MKDGYNLLIWRALEFFIQSPYEEIHLREFSRKLKISPNSAQRFLNLFLTQEFIKEERKANLRYFKANLDNLVFRYLKKTYSIKKLTDSGLVDNLGNKFSNVVLFGSMAKGTDDLKSDVDILCIGDNKNMDCSSYENKLNKEINLHIFSFSEWKKQKDKNKAFYQDIIVDGINLIGEIPIVE